VDNADQDLCMSCRKFLPQRAEAPFLCVGVLPIRSKTSAVSLIRLRTLGASCGWLSADVMLRLSAAQAANEIMIIVLFGIDLSFDSP
jgi:hypothetical protein